MLSTARQIENLFVPEGKIACFWLGQAGFVFKTPDGETIAVDPYFSDCCNRYFGFKRIMPPVMAADETEFDYLFVSHSHYDHFDPDSVPLLLQSGRTKAFFASDCKPECERLGIPDGRVTFVKEGDVFDFGRVKAKAVKCDHGSLAPLAVGFLFDFCGKKIYFTGDTSDNPECFGDPELQGADLLILPVNGAFGNLNETEAADVAARLKGKEILPCHFWNFKEHGGDPEKFFKAAREKRINARLLAIGDHFFLGTEKEFRQCKKNST